MTDESKFDPASLYASGDDVPELELTDEDILDAMQHIPGYLDISTEDFRLVYHLAHRHALTRVFQNLRADRMMRTGIEPLDGELTLDKAAERMARQGLKSLPVVDADNRVIGMLTETDFLRRLQADTFLALLLRLVSNVEAFSHRCHETPVRDAMTTKVFSLPRDSGFIEIVGAFHGHEGRSMPVVDEQGRLLGLLLRKDFLDACHLEGLL